MYNRFSESVTIIFMPSNHIMFALETGNILLVDTIVMGGEGRVVSRAFAFPREPPTLVKLILFS